MGKSGFFDVLFLFSEIGPRRAMKRGQNKTTTTKCHKLAKRKQEGENNKLPEIIASSSLSLACFTYI